MYIIDPQAMVSWCLKVGGELMMEEILHQPGCTKSCKTWDKLPFTWCKILPVSQGNAYLVKAFDCIGLTTSLYKASTSHRVKEVLGGKLGITHQEPQVQLTHSSGWFDAI